MFHNTHTKRKPKIITNAKWLRNRRRYNEYHQSAPPDIPPYDSYKNLLYPDWYNTKIRNSIRSRDKHTCQLCSRKGTNFNLEVHHINYQKPDCKELNLITLCNPCHKSTNKTRHYWYKLLWTKMNV